MESTWPHTVILDDAEVLNTAWNFGAANDLAVAFVGHNNDASAWFEASINYEVNVHACFTPNSQSVSLGASASFDASCSYAEEGSIVGYAWDFGDGATSAGFNPTHVYTDEGCYEVSLAVTDDAGRTGHAVGSVCALGEVPVAVIVLKEGEKEDPEAILEHCRRNMAPFKVPRAVEYLGVFPRNAQGKVLKATIRDRMAARRT